MTTEEILAQLRRPGNEIPREALAAVVERREEFVPTLIAAIEEATKLGDDFDEDDALPDFAVYLLAELRESRALDPILAWFALDEKTETELFGDLIAADGDAILAGVAWGNPSRLREYLRTEKLSPWVRGAALGALVRQALHGGQSRESVVEFFSELLATHAFGDDVLSWTVFVGTCVDFHPAEWLDGIRSLYERKLIDRRIVGDFDVVAAAAARDRETLLRDSAGRQSPITDTARAVVWWECFVPPDRQLPPLTTEEILAQLRHPGNEIPREALATVVERREEFVPLLIAEIEKATKLGENIDQDDSLPFFALYILTELREPRALEPILAWLAVDRLEGESIFGDILGQDSATMLAILARDNPGRLREFARQERLSPWVRGFTFEALTRQVLWGDQPREPLVQYFAELFRTNALRNDDIAWTLLINACMDLHPGELLEEIRGIYERDLVDLFVVGDFDEVEAEAAEDRETHLRQSAQDYPPITDAAEAVSWWRCFHEEDEANDDEDFLADFPGGRLPALPPDDDPFFPEVSGITIRHEQPKIGRNDQCPCGSGKKYKKCCLPAGG